MARKKKEEEEEVYHVEVITKARVTEDGEWEYFVKWAGYDSDADSWEPSDNVQQCERLLASFWKHVGMDNEDYPIGHEIAAEEGWIRKEKRYFEETYVKHSKQKKERQERFESKSSTSHISENIIGDSTSSDEGPSVKAPPAKKSDRKGRAVDSEPESGSQSETESDGHSRKLERVASFPKTAAPPSKGPPKVSVRAKRQEPRSVTDASVSIPPPKPPVIRTHQDQKTNPLVKAMDLPSKSVGAGSSLSTKQRIAAGIPPPPGPKPLQHQPKKSSLSLLSFKKNKLPPPNNPARDATTTTASIATPMSPVAQLADVLNDAEIVSSPQPMDVDQPVDFFDSISDDGPIGGCPDNSAAPILQKSQEEISAETFLQTVDIPALSGPMELDVIPDQLEAPALELTKIPAIPKIPKKWKWSGDLFISTSENKTELLCAINIVDPSGTSNSSHINLLLSSLDSLRISKLYPILLLSPLVRACGKPQYFGKLESNVPGDKAVIHGMEHHLTGDGLAAVVPLLLDGAEVAILVIFPKAQQGLTAALQVPEHLLSDDSYLLVVLLPLLVSVRTSTSVAGLKSIEAVMQSSLDPLDAPILPHEALLYQRMSLLCFPKTLLDFLNSPSRTYCIWPMPDQLSLGLDTAMLQYVLKSTKAIPARLEEDTRVVFIPNSHLGILHTMPSLVAKRVDSPEVQFWTYGYSDNMTCESWGIQEIYPLGGIVTFTSSALAEDLIGCYHLISQIIDHPLWDCYVIPEVLAVTQHLLCGDEDLTSSNECCLGPVMDSITDGLISVTRMPDKTHSNPADWISQTFACQNISGQELLEACFEILRGHPNTSGMTLAQLTTFANEEVTRDLLNAQIQPTLMKSYRRFVVIRAVPEDNIAFDNNGLEWIPLSLFSFKDDYFQQ